MQLCSENRTFGDFLHLICAILRYALLLNTRSIPVEMNVTIVYYASSSFKTSLCYGFQRRISQTPEAYVTFSVGITVRSFIVLENL